VFKEFKSFVLRGNVVELAVALVIGAAFANVVAAAVDLLTNILASLARPTSPNCSSRSVAGCSSTAPCSTPSSGS